VVTNVENELQAYSRREFERVKLKEPVLSTIKLVAIRSYKTDMKLLEPKKIHVINFSVSGLGFVSTMEIPVDFMAVYKINTRLNGEDLELYGKIVRQRKLADHFFDYGFKFSFNSSKKQIVV
jgi:hypothetical protein